MGWLRKKLSLPERITALQMGSAQLETGQQVDLEYLLAIKEQNRNIADLVKHPGWAEYEAALTQMAMTKLRTLARKHRMKDPDADWDAHVIEIINAVLLGMATNAIYESANLERIINNKLTAKARLEERLNNE